VPATEGEKKPPPKKTEAEDLYREIFKQIAQRERVERVPVDSLINVPNTTLRKSKRDIAELSPVQAKPEEKQQPEKDQAKGSDEESDKHMLLIPMYGRSHQGAVQAASDSAPGDCRGAKEEGRRAVQPRQRGKARAFAQQVQSGERG
jgi:hypothetical protein